MMGTKRRAIRLVGFLLISVAMALISGCGGGGTPLSRSTGNPGEVLVVGAYSFEKSALGDSLYALLSREYPYLPQSEKSFGVTFIGEKGFNHMLKPFRNILYIREAPDSVLNEARVQVRLERDKWATSQLVVYLLARDIGDIRSWLNREGETLYRIFEWEELNRLVKDYKRVHNEQLMDSWKAKYGMSPCMPPSIIKRVEEPDYSWASLETPHISQGLIMYRQPVYGGKSLCLDSILAQRDRFTRAFFPGPNEGTYVKVGRVVPPRGEWVLRGGDSVYYIRGFWEVEGHAMGGPFVSYSRLSRGGDSIITASGYVYAPRFAKRDYVRELEAMLGAWQGE